MARSVFPQKKPRISPAAIRAALVTLALLLSGGCATTRMETHVVGVKPPLCREQTKTQTALILWGTAWRDNQKDVAQREEMAGRAIAGYFNTSPCFAGTEVLRQAQGREVMELSDAEVLQFAASRSLPPDKIITVRLEELGPFLIFYLSPILWEGGTSVQLRVRILDAKTAAQETDITAAWKNGGAFVLKGTGSLEEDLEEALAALFGSESQKQAAP